MPPSAKTHFSSSVNVIPYMEYCIQCFGICHIFQFTIWDCCWCCFRILQRKSYWQKNGGKYRSCEKYPEWIFVNTFDIIMAETKPWHRQSFQSCERIDSPRPEWLLESNIWYPQYWIQKPFFHHHHHHHLHHHQHHHHHDHSEEDNACIDGQLTIVCSLCHVGPPGSFWPDVGVVDGRRQDLRTRFCWILSTFWIS